MTNKEFLQAVGMELKVSRIRSKLSLAQVAKMTGLTAECIGDIENGTSDFKILTVKRIADALGKDMKDFF